MNGFETFIFANPFWIWIAIAAVFLTVELASGSGWLLWPAGSAAIVAVVAFFHVDWRWQVVLFAAASVFTTYLGRRFMPRTVPGTPDINDQTDRLVGRHGAAASVFKDGRGRVMVDGKEWSAELEGGDALEKGHRVEVTEILGGARLKVKPA